MCWCFEIKEMKREEKANPQKQTVSLTSFLHLKTLLLFCWSCVKWRRLASFFISFNLTSANSHIIEGTLHKWIVMYGYISVLSVSICSGKLSISSLFNSIYCRCTVHCVSCRLLLAHIWMYPPFYLIPKWGLTCWKLHSLHSCNDCGSKLSWEEQIWLWYGKI